MSIIYIYREKERERERERERKMYAHIRSICGVIQAFANQSGKGAIGNVKGKHGQRSDCQRGTMDPGSRALSLRYKRKINARPRNMIKDENSVHGAKRTTRKTCNNPNKASAPMNQHAVFSTRASCLTRGLRYEVGRGTAGRVFADRTISET